MRRMAWIIAALLVGSISGSIHLSRPSFRLMSTSPASGSTDVAAGPGTPAIRMHFSDRIDTSRLDEGRIVVLDIGAFVPGTETAEIRPWPSIGSAEGAPRIGSDGRALVWESDRRAGGFPLGATVEVRVEGYVSRSGERMAPARFRFSTTPPPRLE